MDNRYYFVLLSNSSGRRVVLQQAPMGWDATKANVIRDLVYLGVLKSVSVELGFVGDGYVFMQQERLRFGMDVDIILRIYLVKNNQHLFDGKINMENYGEERKNREFKVDIIQSSFVQKWNNREDIEINVMNDMSMDRVSIAPPALKAALVRGKEIRFFSEFEGAIVQEPPAPEKYHHLWPFKLKENGNPGVKEVSNLLVDTWVSAIGEANIELDFQNPLILVENAEYSNVLTQEQTIHFAYAINLTAVYQGSLFLGTSDIEKNFVVFRVLKVDSDNTVLSQLFFDKWQVRGAIGSTVNKSYSLNMSESFDPGQYLIFLVERWGMDLPLEPVKPLDTDEMDNTLRTDITYNSMSLTIEQESIVEDTTHPVLLPHELFQAIVSQINGGTLYSEVFGRIDLGYPVTGSGALISICPGTWLRGVPISDSQLKTSMRKAFKSYSQILCLGAQIIKDRVQIDTLDKLFNYDVNTDIGEVEDLRIEPTKEFLFNSIKMGYPNNEYEQENGRDEFNTTYQFTNSFQCVKKDLDLVSQFCGDGYGIEFARRQSVITTGTKDSRYDDKIFFIDLVDDGEGGYMSRRQEDILLVEGIFSPETVINANISVGQNSLRWKKFLNIPLHRKPDKVLYFQSKDKNAGFRVVTALGDTTDGEDIQLGSQAYFLNEGKRFKKAVNLIKLGQLLLNPLGLTRFTYEDETFYDLLMEVNSEIDKHATIWRMLGTRSTPPDVIPDSLYGNYIKYNDGLQDFVKYNDGVDDVIKYAD